MNNVDLGQPLPQYQGDEHPLQQKQVQRTKRSDKIYPLNAIRYCLAAYANREEQQHEQNKIV